MKTKFLISLAITSIAMIAVTFSCSSDVQVNEEFSSNSLDTTELNEGIFNEQTLFGDNIYLPKGTRWYYSNEKRNEIVFELPEEYIFLMKNTETGKHELSSRIAGYSCTCSEGSCTVFHNKQFGYGCLQGSCTGTCAGSSRAIIEKNLQIAGVLNAKNNEVEANNLKQSERASLSSSGLNGFFELREVQEAIVDTYNGIYDGIFLSEEMPDFESEIYDTQKYVYLKTLIYGVEIGMIITRDLADLLHELFPNDDIEVSNFLSSDTPSSCNCSGGSQGGSCKFEKKKNILGEKYTIYYCTGCTTCSMN